MKRIGPTEMVVGFARQRPGGVIRWREARDLYLAASDSAWDEHERGFNGYHMSVNKVLKKHFTKVQGGRGYHVLNSELGETPPLEERYEESLANVLIKWEAGETSDFTLVPLESDYTLLRGIEVAYG